MISIVSASNHRKCVLLSNQKCEIQPTFINLHLNEYSQEFHNYPSTVKLDKCVWSCDTLKSIRRFKSKSVQHNYRNEWTENINIKVSMYCTADSIYCYLIKYWPKQQYYHLTSQITDGKK